MIQQCVVCLEQKWPVEGRPLHVGKALQSSLAASSPHCSTKLLLLPFVLFSFHASISSHIAKENKNEHEPAGTLALNQYKKSQNSLGKEGLGMCPFGFADACHVCLRKRSLLLAILTILLLNHAKGPDSQCSPVYFCLFRHVCVGMSRNHAHAKITMELLCHPIPANLKRQAPQKAGSDTLAQKPQNSTKLRHLPRPCVQTNQFSWLLIHS